MNKKLLALAIGAAVAMPVAALADGPTLYGKLSLSLENQDNGCSTPGCVSDAWVVQNNASRIGVKGSAETGVSGLQGIYLAEFGVKADDGVGPFTGRNIYAGLKGDFGTVMAGNMDTPTKSVQGSVDQFNDTSADIASYVAGELRAPNIVAYASPLIADSVTITVALWQGEMTPDNGATPAPLNGIGDALSASVVYKQDGLYLGLGMDKDAPITGGVDMAAVVAAFAGDNDYNDIVRAVVGYSTDAFEVGCLYQTADDTASGSTASDTSMVLSGAFKAADWKFKAQWGETKGDLLNNTVTDLAVGADYAVGKATTLNALYSSRKDDGTLDLTYLGVGIVQNF